MFDFDEKPLGDIPVVVIDTETTGLYPALGHRVIEVGAVRLEEGKEVGQFSTLLNPGRPIDKSASKVNQIYDSDVAAAPTFAAIAPALLDFIDGALLVAHNATFDAAFIGREIELYAPPEPDQLPLHNPWLCTFKLARQYFHFGRNNLAYIAHSLGIGVGRTHRALNDVQLTVKVLERLAKDLDKKYRFHTAGDLLYAQGGAIYSPPATVPALPPLLAEGLANGRDLTITYYGKQGETTRQVTPRYATQHQGDSYFIAYCHLRREQRTFRVDRILSAAYAD